jgi:hypothetical protein
VPAQSGLFGPEALASGSTKLQPLDRTNDQSLYSPKECRKEVTRVLVFGHGNEWNLGPHKHKRSDHPWPIHFEGRIFHYDCRGGAAVEVLRFCGLLVSVLTLLCFGIKSIMKMWINFISVSLRKEERR